jgi:tetratricopeptide (TPR) repeat protein
MFWRLCSIVLLALASLRVNAASLTDLIVTNEAAGSPVVKVAVVHEAPATNPSASDDLGRFTRQSPRKPARENVGTPDRLNNPGILDRSPNRIEAARKEFEEKLKTYRELAQKEPETYLPSVAATLNDLGILDSDQSRMEEARKEFEEALKIYEAFAKEDPEQFSPHVKRVKKLLKELPR